MIINSQNDKLFIKAELQINQNGSNHSITEKIEMMPDVNTNKP